MSQKKRELLYNEMCRYPADQVPPRTSSRSRQKARHANHTLPRVHNLSMNRIAQGSSRATTCPAAPAPAAQPGAALGPPRVLWLQLPLSSPGQLQGRHVSCGSSSHCPARGSSGEQCRWKCRKTTSTRWTLVPVREGFYKPL
jgi:hypothetical protein